MTRATRHSSASSTEATARLFSSARMADMSLWLVMALQAMFVSLLMKARQRSSFGRTISITSSCSCQHAHILILARAQRQAVLIRWTSRVLTQQSAMEQCSAGNNGAASLVITRQKKKARMAVGCSCFFLFRGSWCCTCAPTIRRRPEGTWQTMPRWYSAT